MLDIHAHLLPGVDDGADGDQMALEMLKAARRAGIDRIVATPHVRRMRTVEQIQPVYERTKILAEEYGILLASGCELSICALAGRTISPEALAPYQIGDTGFVLLEFPADSLPVEWEYLLSDIRRSGFRAIIAHPERYRYVCENPAVALGFLRYDCELQLDAKSFLCGRFSAQRRAAERLLRSGVVSYIASDAHCPKDYDAHFAVRSRLGRRWPSEGLIETLIG